MKILLIAKRGHFPRAGLDFRMPTKALLRLYSYRSVDGSLVHLRLRENPHSVFARSCCLNTNSDTWLDLLIQQQPASSSAASDISMVGAPFLPRGITGSRKLKVGREEKKEEFLPDTAGMLNCPSGSWSAHCTHVNLWSRVHKSTSSQVLWANSWISEKATLGFLVQDEAANP